ncbi:unnamed protein product [Urochloa decumbens]|uniref:Uncharacterized protein n=1 Tax=Urochloa decumbens TaxID=240449 RepID=A0ABC8VS02_9POAL
MALPSTPYRSVTGHISHRGRNIVDLCQTNPFGFTTKLGEVDITSDYGSSGAPLFNGSGDGVGVLQGGDGKFSYSIPLDVVRQTLAQWGGEMYAGECC